MKGPEKLPEVPEPNVPEVNPDELPGPVMPPKLPEIAPEKKPVPLKPEPEVKPPAKER